jgi:hypothetical protein
MLKSLGTGGRQVPTIQVREIDGVIVHSLQVSPDVDLSYAIFDGKLVISTRPEGIAQVRSSGDSLATRAIIKEPSMTLPDRVSALVFLNLDEVLGWRSRPAWHRIHCMPRSAKTSRTFNLSALP